MQLLVAGEPLLESGCCYNYSNGLLGGMSLLSNNESINPEAPPSEAGGEWDGCG